MTLSTNFFIEVLRSYHPSQTLLIEGNTSIAAGELLKTSYNLAISLSNKGIKKGDRVVIAVKPGIEFLQIMYANMMLRTITSIIDTEMGRENYQAKLSQFEPHHAFVDSRLILLNEHPLLKMLLLKIHATLPSFPKIKNCKLFTSGMYLPIFQKHTRIASLPKSLQIIPSFVSTPEHEEFLVTYTSGTLLEPKGVVHTYRGLSNSIKQLTELLRSNKDEVIATHLPHFALLGINAGVKVYLWNAKMSAKDKLDFISKNKITTLFGPPSDFMPMIIQLNKDGKQLPPCLKTIYLGSAPIYTSFLSKLIPLSNTLTINCLYGMTENLMVSIQDGRQKLLENKEGDLVGKPFPNVNISIEPDGEISLESNQLYARYWGTEQITGRHFSGDLGKFNEQGRLILLGRKKDMIIRGNFNIYPGLYEPTMSTIKGVDEVAMVGIYNSKLSDEEVILVVEGDESLTEREMMKLLKFGKYSIDKEALPDKILFMKIPHAGRQQKIDKKQLIKLIQSSKL